MSFVRHLYSRVLVPALALGLLSWLMRDAVGDWVELGQLNHGRGEHGNAVVDGKIYVIGGIFNSTSGPAEIERFDPATGEWSVIGDFPAERLRHHFSIGSSVYGDDIWIVGGKIGNDVTGRTWVDVYNTTTGQWRQGPDLPEILWGGPSVIVGETLHAFAGAQGRNDTENLHYSLDLTDANAVWENQKKVPRPRVHAAGVTIGDKIYMIGGELHHSHDGDTNTLQIYDTVSDDWSFGANVPLRRSHSEWATFVHNGEIWSVSGVDSSNAPNRGQSEIFIYNPADDEWREFEPELPVDLVSPGAKIIDDTLYVYGGGVNDWFGGDLRTTYSLELESDPDFLAGDLNSDGTVSGDDFLHWQGDTIPGALDSPGLVAWQAGYGASLPVNPTDGDFDTDGAIDGTDFLMWQQQQQSNAPDLIDLFRWRTNYGSTGQSAAVSLPEPQVLPIVALLAIAVSPVRGRSDVGCNLADVPDPS